MVILAAVVKYDDRMPFREAHRRSMQTVVHLITDAHEALGNLENFQRTFHRNAVQTARAIQNKGIDVHQRFLIVIKPGQCPVADFLVVFRHRQRVFRIGRRFRLTDNAARLSQGHAHQHFRQDARAVADCAHAVFFIAAAHVDMHIRFFCQRGCRRFRDRRRQTAQRFHLFQRLLRQRRGAGLGNKDIQGLRVVDGFRQELVGNHRAG